MTAATYRLTTNITFYVIPTPTSLSEEGRILLENMLRESALVARTPAGETLFSESVFNMHAWNMAWDPESLEAVLDARVESRTVVVPVQL